MFRVLLIITYVYTMTHASSLLGDVINNKQDQHQLEVLQRIFQLGLQQEKDNDNILKLQTENEELKQMLTDITNDDITGYTKLQEHSKRADQTVKVTLKMGDTVFTVSTSDNDSSVVTYSMTSFPVTPELFEIDPVSGIITVTTNLEFAVDSAYLLTVNATDGLLTSTETLIVNINNINTVPVIHNLPATVYVDENKGANTVIYEFDRDDYDVSQSPTLTFLVWPIGYMSKFFMHQNKQFRIQGGESLNYEEQSYFEVEVFATDGIAIVGPYNLTIIVNDVFEACTFSASTYYITMDEGDAGIMSVDPGFTVTDDDIGDNYSLSIDYTSSTDSTYFSIDPISGLIMFSTNYDVDVTHPSNVDLTIVCTDSTDKTGTATLSVSILDVNDNAPQFTQSGYIFYIDQYDGPMSAMQNVNLACSDADSGMNADLQFTWVELTSGSSSFFHLGVNGQVVLLVYPVLTMSFGDIHSFVITATDGGVPSLTGTTRLDIIYREANSSGNKTIPTTIAPDTNTTVAMSEAFMDEPVNIAVVVLGILTGVLVAAIATFLCIKLNRKPTIVSQHFDRKPSIASVQQKIDSLPQSPQTQSFHFWNQNQNAEIGEVSYIYKAMPAPSI